MHDVVLSKLADLVPHLVAVAAPSPLVDEPGAGASDVRLFHRAAPENRRRVGERGVATRTECPPAKYLLRLPGLDDLLHYLAHQVGLLGCRRRLPGLLLRPL